MSLCSSWIIDSAIPPSPSLSPQVYLWFLPSPSPVKQALDMLQDRNYISQPGESSWPRWEQLTDIISQDHVLGASSKKTAVIPSTLPGRLENTPNTSCRRVLPIAAQTNTSYPYAQTRCTSLFPKTHTASVWSIAAAKAGCHSLKGALQQMPTFRACLYPW